MLIPPGEPEAPDPDNLRNTIRQSPQPDFAVLDIERLNFSEIESQICEQMPEFKLHPEPSAEIVVKNPSIEMLVEMHRKYDTYVNGCELANGVEPTPKPKASWFKIVYQLGNNVFVELDSMECQTKFGPKPNLFKVLADEKIGTFAQRLGFMLKGSPQRRPKLEESMWKLLDLQSENPMGFAYDYFYPQKGDGVERYHRKYLSVDVLTELLSVASTSHIQVQMPFVGLDLSSLREQIKEEFQEVEIYQPHGLILNVDEGITPEGIIHYYARFLEANKRLAPCFSPSIGVYFETNDPATSKTVGINLYTDTLLLNYRGIEKPELVTQLEHLFKRNGLYARPQCHMEKEDIPPPKVCSIS
ncbi:MAG: hypothetical protein WCV90_06955 [Candidatus Woesearchaeota archaeon]